MPEALNPKHEDSATFGQPGLLEGGDGDSIRPGNWHLVEGYRMRNIGALKIMNRVLGPDIL